MQEIGLRKIGEDVLEDLRWDDVAVFCLRDGDWLGVDAAAQGCGIEVEVSVAALASRAGANIAVV